MFIRGIKLLIKNQIGHLWPEIPALSILVPCFGITCIKQSVMADWMQELNHFLGDKGNAQSLPEFDQSDEIKIQEFVSEVFKTGLTKLKEQLNSYQDIKAEISTSKKGILYLTSHRPLLKDLVFEQCNI
jgi:hypothetical protein